MAIGKMKKDLLLGIDFGTGGCKITLIDCKGAVIDSRLAEYPTSHSSPGWAEQNPEDWYSVMCGLLQELPFKERIAALSLDSYTHGAVLLDEDMKVLRSTIIWTDQRSVEECEYLNKNHRDLIFAKAYQVPAPTWTLPQMMWLHNNEPDVLAKTRHISFVKDYIRFLLTGKLSVDYIEAQGTLFFDVERRCWSKELCAIAGIPLEALPAIAEPTDIAGAITAKASSETSLPKGLTVVTGTSDSAIEDYAAGAVKPGQCILKLATAGNVNVMTSEPHPHAETLTYSHVVPGMWYTATATNAAAICQRWFRDNFCAGEVEKAKEQNVNVYDLIDKEAASSPIGSNGVFFHPYLMGERSPYWDSDLRASFTGMSMATTRGDCARALLEGVAFSLKDCYRTIEKMGLVVDEFILIGGGAKSPLWSRIICDLFNAPVKSPVSCDASFGSALLAGVGVGIFADELSAVEQCLEFKQQLNPVPENSVYYKKQFSHYREIHDAMAEIYKNIKTTS